MSITIKHVQARPLHVRWSSMRSTAVLQPTWRTLRVGLLCATLLVCATLNLRRMCACRNVAALTFFACAMHNAHSSACVRLRGAAKRTRLKAYGNPERGGQTTGSVSRCMRGCMHVLTVWPKYASTTLCSQTPTLQRGWATSRARSTCR